MQILSLFGHPILGLALDVSTFLVILKLIGIDIVLGADNAVVIAMAAKNLNEKDRKKAVMFGTAGAVILRIGLAFIAAALLEIPFVQAIGSFMLAWIAFKLLAAEEGEGNVKAGSTIMSAIGSIIIADFVMSLDNVIALVGAANGHMGLLIIGVIISIPIIVFASNLIMKAMDRFPIITYIGSAILAWVAGEMLVKDKWLEKLIHLHPYHLVIQIAFVVIIVGAGILVNRKKKETETE